MTLTADESVRYSRHFNLPEVGKAGQEKLKAARVLLIGAGGLGSPIGLYLAAAGVGCLGIVDFDVVDQSNLQRQVLHGSKDVGSLKTASARERLRDLNPLIEVITYNHALDSSNALDIIRQYDIVVDGTDNFPTRYLVNDACVLLGKPNVYGSIFRFEGQVSVFDPARGSPCYRCLYPEPPPPGMVPSCAEGGVLGVLPGVVGSLQATEVLKLILGVGELLLGRLLLFEALSMRFQQLKLQANSQCLLCGPQATIKHLQDYRHFCGLGEEVAPEEFLSQWQKGRRPLLVDVREAYEWDIVNLADYGAQLLEPEQWLTLDKESDIVVHCKAGGRSAQAQAKMLQSGFTRVRNLQGGILAWIERVEPSWPKY